MALYSVAWCYLFVLVRDHFTKKMIFIAMEYFRELKGLCVGGSGVRVLLEKVNNPVFDGLAASRWNRYFIYLFILLLSLSFLSFFFFF